MVTIQASDVPLTFPNAFGMSAAVASGELMIMGENMQVEEL